MRFIKKYFYNLLIFFWDTLDLLEIYIYNLIRLFLGETYYELFPALLLTNGSNSRDSREDNTRELEDRKTYPQDNHNAPEQIVDDLDSIDAARKGDANALDVIKRNYPVFFEENSDEQALNEIEAYLEEEFDPELERSEKEADELDKLAGRPNTRNTYQDNNSSDNESKHSRSPEGEKEDGVKRRKFNSDDDDNNSSNPFGGLGSSSSGPSGSSGPSDNSSNFSSKIIIFISGSLETLAMVFENLYH